MARVNHKKVKQLIAETRGKITDRQFFTSRILAGHFEDMAAAQSKRYHYNCRVRVNLYWNPKDPDLASTNNTNIIINTGNKLVTRVKGRENRYQVVCGLFAHELGHVLYTDFLANQSYRNSMARYHWFPKPPDISKSSDIRNESALWDYVKQSQDNAEIVITIAHQISNVLEDGYVEDRMLTNFPGTLGMGLQTLRDLHFEQIPTLTQLIEEEEDGNRHIFESILQVMLSYAKFGKIKYGDEPVSDPRVQIVFGLLDEIDRALMSGSAKERLDVVNLILIRCWNDIQDFCEICKQRQKEAAAADSSVSITETLSGILKSVSGGSSIGEGSSAPVGSSGFGSAVAAVRARTRAEAAEKEESGEDSSDLPESEDINEDPSESEEKPQDPSGSEAGTESPDASGIEGESSSVMAGGKQETSDKEEGRIPLQQTSGVSEPVGGTVEQDDDYKREAYDRAAADIERVLETMAEKAACEQLESERLQTLNEAAQSISYGNIHAGVNIRVNRITAVDEDLVEQFDTISSPLLTISRQLQKSITQQLRDQRRGGKQTGLLMGRRLDSHALHRQDGKVFTKNALPNETPELAVALLLDESGSMRSCDRCTYARASAIILYDFCRSLDIPVMVYGHSTGYSSSRSTVELYSYAEFEAIDHDDKYRMMDIAARGSNRDGAALRFVAEQLSKRPEEVKILILVSDGQPADTDYYGTAAEEDLRGIKQEYQRKGILLVAAAIGDDKQNIERIYGDSFMDITDLNQLPVKLTTLVKRHIRV